MISVRSRAPRHTSRSRGRATPNTWSKGPVSDMQVGILGSGLMGGKLGTIVGPAGREEGFSHGRSEEKREGLGRGGASGKKIPVELIRDVGFDPVDAGPLRIARYTEPFALLVAQLAYEGDGGPELAYRFERVGRKG